MATSRPLSSDQHDVADFVGSQIGDLESRLASHMDSRFDELRTLFLSGFPDGDPRGHKDAHLAQIRESEARAAFYRSLTEKSLLGVALALIGVVGSAMWMYLKSQLGSGP